MLNNLFSAEVLQETLSIVQGQFLLAFWETLYVTIAAMFFAVFKSLANIADSTVLAQLGWSSNIYNMMPFIASMVILAFTSKNSQAPKAEGIPYDKGSR